MASTSGGQPSQGRAVTPSAATNSQSASSFRARDLQTNDAFTPGPDGTLVPAPGPAANNSTANTTAANPQNGNAAQLRARDLQTNDVFPAGNPNAPGAGSGTTLRTGPETGASAAPTAAMRARDLQTSDLAPGRPSGTQPANGTAQSFATGDLNAPTPSARPADDINAPATNNPNAQSRPLAPAQNPADQPLAPFTRGAEQRLQAGFNEPAAASGTTGTAADGSQFLRPATGQGSVVAPAGGTGVGTSGVGTGSVGPGVLPTYDSSTGAVSDGSTVEAAAGTEPSAQPGAAVAQDSGAQQPGTPAARVRPTDPPVGTQKSPVTTEALKVPAFKMGAQLKATPEGVVVSSLTESGLAAESKLESGDIIETIGGRPIVAPGAVAYELHRHKAGSTVDVGILRGGRRMTHSLKLPNDHQPQLLNRNETFGESNNEAKEQGGSAARKVPVNPTEQSQKTLEENRELREEVNRLKAKS